MAIRNFRPTTSARRKMSTLINTEITKDAPEKSLVDTCLVHFGDVIQMPMFFFVSGLMLKTSKLSRQYVIRKVRSYMMPAITLGLLFTFFTHSSLYDFIWRLDTLGYWFLYVLSIFYLCSFYMANSSQFPTDQFLDHSVDCHNI